MALTDSDMFGHPVALPRSISHPVRRREVSPENKRSKLLRHLSQSSNLVLFDELLDYLKAPLLKQAELPEEYSSDIGKVVVAEEDEDEESRAASVQVPYDPWGNAWVVDRHGLGWSHAGLVYTQVRLFWRSMEELALSNNEQEKWSVLRWIFRPAIWKYYVYNKLSGTSRCLEVHERDEPFSFHNCCIAARMDEDAVREGVRRNVPAEVVKAVEKVCKFD